MFRLVDVLEDLDDVQNIFANYDVPDAVMEELDAPSRTSSGRVRRA